MKYIATLKPHLAEILIAYAEKIGITEVKTEEKRFFYQGQQSIQTEITFDLLQDGDDEKLDRVEWKLTTATATQEIDDLRAMTVKVRGE